MSIQSSPTSKIDLSSLYPNKEKYKSVLTALDQFGRFAIQPDGVLKITGLWQGASQTDNELIGLSLEKILKFGAKRGWLEEDDKTLIDSLAQKCGIVPKALFSQKSKFKQSQTKKPKLEDTSQGDSENSQMLGFFSQSPKIYALNNEGLSSSVPLVNTSSAEASDQKTDKIIIEKMCAQQPSLQVRIISIKLHSMLQQMLRADPKELLTLKEKVVESERTLEGLKKEASNPFNSTIEELESFCDYLLKEIEKLLKGGFRKKEIEETSKITKRLTAYDDIIRNGTRLKDAIGENSKDLEAICKPLRELGKLFHQNEDLLKEDLSYITDLKEFRLKKKAVGLYEWYLTKITEIFEEYIKPLLDPQHVSSDRLLQSIPSWKTIAKIALTNQDIQDIYCGLGYIYETLASRESDKNTENARSWISSALYWFLKATVYDKNVVSKKIDNLIDQAPIYIDNESCLSREQLEELRRVFFIEDQQDSGDRQKILENKASLLDKISLASQFIDITEISTEVLLLKWTIKNEPPSKNKETLKSMYDLLSKGNNSQ